MIMIEWLKSTKIESFKKIDLKRKFMKPQLFYAMLTKIYIVQIMGDFATHNTTFGYDFISDGKAYAILKR